MIRPVGQGVKTPPSHGGNTGSIPVLAAESAIKQIGCTFSFARKIKDTGVFLASIEKQDLVLQKSCKKNGRWLL